MSGEPPTQQSQQASKVTNIPNLANSVVNLATLRDQSRKELIDVLDTVRKINGYIDQHELITMIGSW